MQAFLWKRITLVTSPVRCRHFSQCFHLKSRHQVLLPSSPQHCFFSDWTFTVLAWLSPRHQAHIVDESTLHRHCFSAMIGVPSPTFTLNHTSCSLSPSPNLIRLEDVSPAALRNALLPFAHAGTAAFRISLLAAHASSPSSALPFTVKSLIFFATANFS